MPSLRRSLVLPLVASLVLPVIQSTAGVQSVSGRSYSSHGPWRTTSARPADSDAMPSDGRVMATWQAIAAGDHVRAILVSGHELWLGTAGGGVVRWPGDGTWRQYLAPQDGLPANDVHAVVHWRNQYWFGTSRGLARYEPDEDRMVVVDVGVPTPEATALLVDGADRLWVGATQVWDPEAAGPEPGTKGAWRGGGLAFSADGILWQWQSLADGLPSLAVRDLALWRGNVWLASEPYWSWREAQPAEGIAGRWELVGGGVAAYRDGRWYSFDQSKVGALSDRVRHLAASPRALWAGTLGRGLVAYDGQRWQGYTDCGQPLRCLLADYVTALAVGPDGAVWVSTARFNGRGVGLQVLDDGGTPTQPQDDGWFAYTTANGLPAERVNAIAPHGDGSIWLALADSDGRGNLHGRSLARLLADRTSFVGRRLAEVAPGNLASNDVTCLARNPANGELWVGTSSSGISVRGADGVWRHYTRASTGGGLAGDDVADIAIGADGVIWVATRQQTYDPAQGRWVDGGLSRFDGRQWVRLPAAVTGLPSDQLSALALDGRGRLWIGTGATDFGQKEHSYRGWGLAVLDTASQRWLRTYTYPDLPGDNVTDLAVASKLWLTAAYFAPPDEAARRQPWIGGGASSFDFQSEQWRTYGWADGLRPAVATGTAEVPIFDYRAVAVDRSGAAWLGGLVYAGQLGATGEADGVIDVLGPSGTAHYRFAGSGPVTALALDSEDRVWAATASSGLRVFTGNDWVPIAPPTGLALRGLTALSIVGQEAWLGSSPAGLTRLTDIQWQSAVDQPTPAPLPTATERPIPAGYRLYLPLARH